MIRHVLRQLRFHRGRRLQQSTDSSVTFADDTQQAMSMKVLGQLGGTPPAARYTVSAKIAGHTVNGVDIT